jgi:predicted O-methyltransferase YrrM
LIAVFFPERLLPVRIRRSFGTKKMRWLNESHFQVGNANFLVTTDPALADSALPSDQLLLQKNPRLIETLLRCAPTKVERILDLGIFRGGSIALYNELFSPRRLVGIDLNPDRVDSLDRFIARHSLTDTIRLYHGTHQDDPEALTDILRDDFDGEPLDLIIDDCSHMYEPSKGSFNFLLPRLRPGGLYVIEDWGWAHWPAPRWQQTEHQYSNEATPLSQLILELVMVSASRPDLIREVTVWHSAVYITRGDEVISDTEFDISSSILTDGRRILCDHPPK